MNEDFWNDLMAHLLPDVTIFPWYNNDKTLSPLYTYFVNDSFPINWNNYPENQNFNHPDEIIPLLHKLLQHPFDNSVYVYAPYDLFSVIKAPLDAIVSNYPRLHNTDYIWMWNPTEGYAIEDDGFGHCTVGLVTKTEDPYPTFELKKDFFSRNDVGPNHRLRHFISYFGIKLINDTDFLDEANKILALFQATYPLTPSGTMDWDRINRKIILGKNPQHIITELEKLTGQAIAGSTAYIEWPEGNLPLIQIDLQKTISHYDQLVQTDTKIIIFDLTNNYVIEITPTGDITLGTVKEDVHSSSHSLPKKNTSTPSFLCPKTPFHNFLKSFGVEIIMDSEANEILANLQKKFPFTCWGGVDWEQFEKKSVLGENPTRVFTALATLLTKPFDPTVYIAWKESNTPLAKIKLTAQMADCWPIWVNSYGSLLFNLEEGYIIEIDALKRITIGALKIE